MATEFRARCGCAADLILPCSSPTTPSLSGFDFAGDIAELCHYPVDLHNEYPASLRGRLDIGHHWIRREKWGYRKVRVVALPYGLTADNQLTTLTYFCAPAANNHAAATDSSAGYGNGLPIDQYR